MQVDTPTTEMRARSGGEEVAVAKRARTSSEVVNHGLGLLREGIQALHDARAAGDTETLDCCRDEVLEYAQQLAAVA